MTEISDPYRVRVAATPAPFCLMNHSGEDNVVNCPNRASSGCRQTFLTGLGFLSGWHRPSVPCTELHFSLSLELVLKVRIQNPSLRENDFIEIELDRQELTYQELLRVSCCELGVNPDQVEKIRKLPNTLLRKVRSLPSTIEWLLSAFGARLTSYLVIES